MWLYSIKNMSHQSSCPDSVAGTEVEDLFHQAELAKMTNEQRTSFEVSVMSRNDMLNSFRETLEAAKEEVKAEAVRIGRAEGLVEGRAEGLVEGRAEGEILKAKEIAAKLIATGLSRKEVAALVGLDEVEF